MNLITEILLGKESSFSTYSINGKSGKDISLEPLSQINLFVGANNSGKSRFMRELAKVTAYQFHFDSISAEYTKLQNEFFEQLGSLYKANGIAEIQSGLPKIENHSIHSCAIENEEFLGSYQAAVKQILKTEPNQVQYTFRGHTDISLVVKRAKELANSFRTKIPFESDGIPLKILFNRLYIPVLRGLRRLDVEKDLYKNRTGSDYFATNPFVEVFTGQSLYDDIKQLLLGSLDDREIISDFQKFLSKAFFHGSPVALIPRHDSDLHVKIGDETEYPISGLGDGIQSIIILTFPLFRARGKRLLVFIEEPEMYLHPGLQRLLLTVLLTTDGFASFQYFISSHSNHFLDLTLDLDKISVFTFRKELENSDKRERGARFEVENVSNENDQTLHLLGVRNSSVFFSNCTIWVEGVTDRRYFSKYIDLYEEFLVAEAVRIRQNPPSKFKQDLHYSFVEYSGSNITHWSFLDDQEDPIVVERICGKLFLITDKDDAENKSKSHRHERLREKLGDRYCCLPCREVENLLSVEVLCKVVQEYEGGSAEFSNVKHSSYIDKPLGKFISNNLLRSPKQRRGSYHADGGTVSDKVGFCQKALRHFVTFSDLSPEAQEVTRQIYAFIQVNNR